MEVNLMASSLNVSDLDRSIDFYRSVFQLDALEREREGAVLLIHKAPRRQVLMLRRTEDQPHYSSWAATGPTTLWFEAPSRADFEQIEEELGRRDAIDGRRGGSGWEALLAHDPDRIDLAVVIRTSDEPFRHEDLDWLLGA